jgi:RsiW-degrading membrane proteinase PrsW (M82 family)
MSGSAALGAAVALLLLPTVLYVLIVWLADKNEKEPLVDILLALVGGALVAPLLVAAAERVLGIPDSIYPPKLSHLPFEQPNLTGALVEELAKGLVILGLFLALPREFDNVMDGIVYGTVVGAGFALAENAAYVWELARVQHIVQLGLGSFWALFLGGLSHCVFSGIFGASLGLVREGPFPPRRLVWVPLLGLALASLYHTAYLMVGRAAGAYPPLSAIVSLADWAGLIFLAAIVGWAWHHEASIIHTMLGDEVDTGAVTAGELALLGTTGARTANELHALAVGGLRGYWLTRSLHQAQVDLAFRKWHLANRERLKGDQRATSDAENRARIADLRARLRSALARAAPGPARPGS